MRLDLGGNIGAIPVASGETYTAPANTFIYSVVPHLTWAGKAIAKTGFSHMTADRNSSGGNVPTRSSAFFGAYESVTCATGSTCDVYLQPLNELQKV